MAEGDEPNDKSEDVVVLVSPTEDGKGARVLRARDGNVEAGEVRPVKEGAPIHGEIVELAVREKTPWLCDVKKTLYKKTESQPPPAMAAAPVERKTRESTKPPQVATHAYRASWDRIFGPEKSSGSLN